MMVNHKGEQTKFLIWDRECEQLIGQSADEVNRLKIKVCYCIVMQCFLIYIEHLLPCYRFSFFFSLRKDGDVDLNASPQALDRLLGCFLAFKVKVQPRFRNFVVLKYSDESDLINVVLDMIPDSEVVFCQIYFSYCECMHIFHLFFNCRFIYHLAMLQDREFNT